MHTLIWALGSMIIILLGLFIIPLGFTFKGKVTISLASFLLALGGIAAASSFPLWETALMLLALVFMFTYFINKRMGTLVYQSASHSEPALVEAAGAPDTFESSPDTEDFLRDNSINVINEQLKLPDASLTTISKKPLMSDDSHSTLNELDLVVQREPEMEEAWKQGVMDEDLSLLLREEIDFQNEEQQLTDTESKVGYLSAIENLVQLESAGEPETIEDNGLDNLLEEINTKKPVSPQ